MVRLGPSSVSIGANAAFARGIRARVALTAAAPSGAQHVGRRCSDLSLARPRLDHARRHDPTCCRDGLSHTYRRNDFHISGQQGAVTPVRRISPQFIGGAAVRLYKHSLCSSERRARSEAIQRAKHCARRAEGSLWHAVNFDKRRNCPNRQTKSGRASRPFAAGLHPSAPLALPARNGGF